MTADQKLGRDIPTGIVQTLNPRYRTDYHSGQWEFLLSRLNQHETEIVESVEQLFKPSLRWKAEAVAIRQGAMHTAKNIVGFMSMTIGMHTTLPTPTLSTGLLFWKRKFLNLNDVISDEIPTVPTENYGMKHGASLPEVPRLGRFKTSIRDNAATPYFVNNVELRPFYHYKKGQNIIAGEDTSRLFIDVSLLDGRDVVRSELSGKFDQLHHQLGQAATEQAALQQRIKDLETKLKDGFPQERALLLVLQSRKDPFAIKTSLT